MRQQEAFSEATLHFVTASRISPLDDRQESLDLDAGDQWATH